MEHTDINIKVSNSIKWSSLAEISAKFVSPFTSMVLARILTPDEFGIIATVNMVTSFADIFTDAGFQKYLIQEKFQSENELKKSANVAFWTNLGISIAIWFFISFFSEQIAVLVGNQGLGNVIVIASIALVFTSFSSIQTAIYKKKFDFKTLFYVRLLGVFVPVIVTIPLALLGYSYWSVIIGTLVTQFLTALLLTLKSEWKPYLYFNSQVLKRMFGFSVWILIESILLWLTSYIDVFFVGNGLNSYYLGLYKNSITVVNGLFNIVISATSSVLLSTLAVVKENKTEYDRMFFGFQRSVGILLIPIGVGVFIYRDLATSIIFGNQWSEASLLIGLWGLANAFTILTGQYISIVFTSKGKPKLAVLSQVLQLFELIPLLLLGLNFGFKALIVTRCIARLLYGVINLLIARIYLRLHITKTLKNLLPSVISSIIMGMSALVLMKVSDSYIWQFVTIAIDALIYFTVSMAFPSSRGGILGFVGKLSKNKRINVTGRAK